MGTCFPDYANYGWSANALSVNVTEIKVVRDPWATERCDFQVDLVEYSYVFQINVGIAYPGVVFGGRREIARITLLED